MNRRGATASGTRLSAIPPKMLDFSHMLSYLSQHSPSEPNSVSQSAGKQASSSNRHSQSVWVQIQIELAALERERERERERKKERESNPMDSLPSEAEKVVENGQFRASQTRFAHWARNAREGDEGERGTNESSAGIESAQ